MGLFLNIQNTVTRAPLDTQNWNLTEGCHEVLFTQPYNFFPFCGVSFFLSRVISTKIPWRNLKYYFFSLSSYPHLFHSCTILIQLTQPSVLIFKWFTEDQAKLPLWPFFPPLIRRLQTYIQWEKKKRNLFFPFVHGQKQHLTVSMGTFPAP